MTMLSLQHGPKGMEGFLSFIEFLQDPNQYKAEVTRLQGMLKDINKHVEESNKREQAARDREEAATSAEASSKKAGEAAEVKISKVRAANDEHKARVDSRDQEQAKRAKDLDVREALFKQTQKTFEAAQTASATQQRLADKKMKEALALEASVSEKAARMAEVARAVA